MNRFIKRIAKYFCLLTLPIVFFSCQEAPSPILFGKDACDNCKMTITDPKFAAELISSKGKIYKFDSAECLAKFEKSFKKDDVGSEWVTNFLSPGEFLLANKALFIVSDNIRSPMGLNIVAFSSQKSWEDKQAPLNQRILNWKDVQSYVQSEWK